MTKASATPPPGGQFLVYQTEDGKLKIEVRFEGENVGQHLKSTFAEGELIQDSVVKDSFTTAADGKNYVTRFYNLDAIISVGYRVNRRTTEPCYSRGGRGNQQGILVSSTRH